jgi:beta-lactamase superfamily II metal-dependent hydrolase
MLIDAADSEHGQAIVNYLWNLKISKIDILVATHPHEDHIGGMPAVLSAFTFGKVWDSGYVHTSDIYEKFLTTILNKKIPYGKPRAGFSQKVGTATVQVLSPVQLLSGTDSDANNNSLILRIVYGRTSFLLAGDIQDEGRAAVKSWPKSTVLKVSHHGAANGTNAAFLKAVAPSYAVISVGAQNDYSHPNAGVVSLLKASCRNIYLTSTSGACVFSTDGSTVQALTMKGNADNPGMVAVPVQQPASSSSYIGNANSKVFHRPSCSRLPDQGNRVYFNARNDALAAGYQPCRICDP